MIVFFSPVAVGVKKAFATGLMGLRCVTVVDFWVLRNQGQDGFRYFNAGVVDSPAFLLRVVAKSA